jgi:hypothetical protein
MAHATHPAMGTARTAPPALGTICKSHAAERGNGYHHQFLHFLFLSRQFRRRFVNATMAPTKRETLRRGNLFYHNFRTCVFLRIGER